MIGKQRKETGFQQRDLGALAHFFVFRPKYEHSEIGSLTRESLKLQAGCFSTNEQTNKKNSIHRFALVNFLCLGFFLGFHSFKGNICQSKIVRLITVPCHGHHAEIALVFLA